MAVRNVDCVDECVRLRALFPDCRLGLLNMASDICPGGGVRKGARAQEEEICRRTTLYPSLLRRWYPLAANEMIYSENVLVVKDGVYERVDAPVLIDGVLSVPAVRRPAVVNGMYRHATDRVAMRLKIRLTLQTAAYHGLDCLVLGAHGLGCFGNPREEVSHMFADLLAGDFRGAFRHVSFAILERGKTELNDLFARALHQIMEPPKPGRSS